MPAARLDPFAALAEQRRRRLVTLLAEKPGRPVRALVDTLGIPQPAVSKHLAVLRAAGLVTARRRGRERHYSLRPQSLRPVHDWIKAFEHFGTRQLAGIKERAERDAATRKDRP